VTVRTCTHAACRDVIDNAPCAWQPDPTSKRHVWDQAETHGKTAGHVVEGVTLPAEDCAVHREGP
jgi:hypothetical protein